MKSNKLLFYILGCILSLQSIDAQNYKSEIVLSDKVQPLSQNNIFRDSEYFNWCNSIIKGKDGKYHMFYARWNRDKHFQAWLTHSTVAHAVADYPEGPYKYVNTVLDFQKDEYRKGGMITAHNPKIKYFNGKYYLYFISTKFYRDINNDELLKLAKLGLSNNDRKYLREQQRTFVAVADDLNGEWKIRKESLLEPSGPIRTLVVNPAITQGPDQRFYMIVKGDKPGTTKFERNQAVAISDYPDHGFVLQSKPVIKDWDTEDVSMWYDKVSERFYAVFHAHKYIGMMTSKDGINWEKAQDFVVTKKCLQRKDGKEPLLPGRMERPFVFIEDNIPSVLGLAISKNGDSYILTIPLEK